MILISLMMFSLVSTKHYECSVSAPGDIPRQGVDLLFALAAAYVMIRQAHSDTILRLPRTDNPDIVEEVPVKKGTTVVMDFVGISIACYSSIRFRIQFSQVTILKHSRIRKPFSLGDGRRLRLRRVNPPPKLNKQAKSLRLTQ